MIDIAHIIATAAGALRRCHGPSWTVFHSCSTLAPNRYHYVPKVFQKRTNSPRVPATKWNIMEHFFSISGFTAALEGPY